MPHPTGDYLNIKDAADNLGVKPWDVVRLIESGQLPTVTLVPARALAQLRGAMA